MGLERLLSLLEILGDGFAVVPFGFTTNNGATPDGLIGKSLASVAFTANGKYTCTLVTGTVPYACYAGFAVVCNTSDGVDMTAKVDWSSVASAGTFVVRTMTGTSETEPADNTLVGGFLLVKKNSR